MAAAKKPDYPIISFKTPKEFDAWLSKNYKSAPGVWIRFGKKASGLKSITYHEALDIALCHGWIDGLRKKFDEDTFVQKFTPRGPKSIWSRINKDKALALIEAKKMRAALGVPSDDDVARVAYSSGCDCRIRRKCRPLFQCGDRPSLQVAVV